MPLDGTTESQHALRWALSLARRIHCDIEVVHVLVEPPRAGELYGVPVPSDWTTEHTRSVAYERLTRIVDALAKLGVQSTITMLEGAVPSALAEYFDSSATDFVVMAMHHASRLEHLLFGSVVGSVTRHVHVPVLVIPASTEAPAFSSLVDIKRVLVPLDGSEVAEQIIPVVSTLAAATHPEIVLLRVIAPAAAGRAPIGEFAGIAQDLRHTATSVHSFALVDNDPAQAIIDYAEQHEADVIAMTTSGRGAFARVVLGSVATGVLRHAHRPVLLLRPRS